MEPLLSAEETRKIDEYTSDVMGITTDILMECAARALAAEIQTENAGRGPVLLLCGVGNNGGDGMALARLLFERGFFVRLITVGSEKKATPLWMLQRERLDDIKEKSRVLNENQPRLIEHHIEGSFTKEDGDILSEFVKGAAMVVDALFGVGLSRPITGVCASLIDEMNKHIKARKDGELKVLAVDMPSGISADTGAVLGTALPTDVTVTFGYRKRGQILYPGAMYCKDVRIVDIGFADFYKSFGASECFSAGRELLENLPTRSADTNKGSYGKLLVVAGSPGMAGAALLSAKAGYRTGCGLVYVLTPEENRVIIQSQLPEAVYLKADEKLTEQILSGGYSAALIGPGLSETQQAGKLLYTALKTLSIPLVLDADALNLIAHDEGLKKAVKKYPHGVIMTPHRAEMARLLGLSIPELKSDPVKAARLLSDEFGCVCVAKDSRTVVYAKDRGAYICEAGNDGMATGGSGDVLAGIIGGLLAQRPGDVYSAAVLGVSVHAWAGDEAARRLGKRFMLAGDIIEGMREILR